MNPSLNFWYVKLQFCLTYEIRGRQIFIHFQNCIQPALTKYFRNLRGVKCYVSIIGRVLSKIWILKWLLVLRWPLSSHPRQFPSFLPSRHHFHIHETTSRFLISTVPTVRHSICPFGSGTHIMDRWEVIRLAVTNASVTNAREREIVSSASTTNGSGRNYSYQCYQVRETMRECLACHVR